MIVPSFLRIWLLAFAAAREGLISAHTNGKVIVHICSKRHLLEEVCESPWVCACVQRCVLVCW